MDNLDTTGGNEEVLPSTATSDGGADSASETASETVTSTGGFSSRFQQARERAFSDNPEEDDTKSTDSAEGNDKASDEKVPEEDAEDETGKDEESTEEKTDEKTETPEEDKKSSKRGENFKQVLSERDTALAENSELKTRLETFEQKFEKFGGFDAVETAVEVANALADPTKIDEFTNLVQKLPHRAQIHKKFFDTALSREENRVYGVNRVLREEFGLNADLSKTQMEKAFEFLAHKLNEDSEGFDGYLERELELANTPERELARTKAELERLKNPEAAKTQNNSQSSDESEFDFLQRIQKTHDEFEDGQFTSVSAEVAADYGLQPSKNDTPAVREAKEFILDAVKFAVGVQMRSAKAHEALLGYWVENRAEGAFYNQAVKNYQNAMRTRVQHAFKQVSRLIQVRTEVKTTTPKKELPSIADGAKAKTEIAPKQEPKKAQTGGFRSAFSEAKRSAIG